MPGGIWTARQDGLSGYHHFDSCHVSWTPKAPSPLLRHTPFINRTHMKHGSLAWSFCTSPLLSKLDKIQRRPFRLIQSSIHRLFGVQPGYGSMGSVPQDGILACTMVLLPTPSPTPTRGRYTPVGLRDISKVTLQPTPTDARSKNLTT